MQKLLAIIILIILAVGLLMFLRFRENLRGTKKINYSVNTKYNINFQLKNTLSESENLQFEQFKKDIEALVTHLQNSIVDLIVEYANIIYIFPIEGPTFKDTIQIFFSEKAPNDYFTNTEHEFSFEAKGCRSSDEEALLDELKNKLDAIILAQQGLSLRRIFDNHNNLILCFTNDPVLELEFQIFMRKKE